MGSPDVRIQRYFVLFPYQSFRMISPDHLQKIAALHPTRDYNLNSPMDVVDRYENSRDIMHSYTQVLTATTANSSESGLKGSPATFE